MSNKRILALALLFAWTISQAQITKPFDPALAFGARPSVTNMHLSPDGMSVAYISATQGRGSIAYTLSLAKGSVPKPTLSADGRPYRLEDCQWVSNDRIVCMIYAVISDAVVGRVGMTRVVAADAGGKNVQVLSTRENQYTRGYQFGGGSVIDWLPDEMGAVLMTRVYLPDDHTGSHLGSTTEGLGVDWIDTRTLAVKHVEPPRIDAIRYITDGRGTVRIVGSRNT